MKVIILSVTSGEGHNSIAKALKNEFEKNNITANIIDCFKDKYWLADKVIDKGYQILCRHFTGLYHRSYKKGQNILADSKDSGWFTYAVNKVKRKIFEEVETFAPDFIVCTHPLSSRIYIEMKKEYKGLPKALATLSDYSVHPCWEKARDIDFLETPTEEYNELLIKKGFSKEQFVCLGIPVEEKFSVEINKAQARKELGLEDKTTLMLMNGGFGVGNDEKLIQELCNIDADFQMIIINGKNEKSKLKLDKLIEKNKVNKKILNLGFVKNVDVIMSASNAMLGKAGCISINEALNKKLPMIIRPNQIGQEYDNMKFLVNNHAAINIDNVKNTVKVVEEYMKNPEKLKEFQSGIEKIRKPNACKDVVKFIIKQIEEDGKAKLSPLVGTKAAKKKISKNKKQKKIIRKSKKIV